MTKIDIVSGFLGAGKTTLINRLIREAYAGETVVLIENEFGEIGIDGGFLQDSGVKISEMNSGCICCSLVGDFSRALAEVTETYHPDRILIEPSGVGKLSDVTKAVLSAEVNNTDLNSAVVVVDVNKCKMYMKNFGEFFNDQIIHAGCIVFSHTDKTTEQKLSEALKLVREKNADATVITTPADQLDIHTLTEAMENKHSLEEQLKHDMEHDNICPVCGHHHDHDDEEEHEHHHHDHNEHEHHHHDHDNEEHHDSDCCCGHNHEHEHHHHHHADEVFTSWGMETVEAYTQEQIFSMLQTLTDEETYGIILRAKGIVRTTDGKWLHFDYVPGEPDVRFGSSAAIGKLCVIGSHIHEEALQALFTNKEQA